MAQRVLVRQVSVTSPKVHELITRLAPTEFVRSLQIEYASPLPRILHSLPRFSNLRHLDISFPGFSSIDDPALLALAPPTIESLRTANRAPVVVAFVAAWPTLRFLDATLRSAYNDTLPPPAKNAFYEIRWRVNPFADNDMSDFFWAANNSTLSLRILDLTKLPSVDLFDQFMQSHPHLHSLRLLLLPTEYIPSLSHLSSLLEFVVVDQLTPLLFHHLSPTIQHLSFCAPFPDNFIHSLSAYPDLRQLTIHEVESIPNDIIDYCKSRKIVIYTHPAQPPISPTTVRL
ncbi:hypothetical protein SISSUDRAFT_1057478 [Sistotremastrum suecicum HHB10207 ss-3]|uniref:F-box domain-containing protein n=1 Tax=Sistotremastrum suecicum HHB10207 ss-3 TaxID=1314776 RepID=A0A166I6Z1_9AGAM|nr:hypothetical protein SISSUDRAFT_1057478 [Sistotremastrum suecicum HHB10207 ss-3]